VRRQLCSMRSHRSILAAGSMHSPSKFGFRAKCEFRQLSISPKSHRLRTEIRDRHRGAKHSLSLGNCERDFEVDGSHRPNPFLRLT
jgi:hypothetical protein